MYVVQIKKCYLRYIEERNCLVDGHAGKIRCNVSLYFLNQENNIHYVGMLILSLLMRRTCTG